MTTGDAQIILKPIQNYGIGSARFCSGFDAGLISKNTHCFDIPSGMFVVRWNVDSKTQIWKKQLHNSLIGCHVLSPCHTMCLTVSFDSEVALWDTNYNLLDKLQMPQTMDIRCAAWRSDGKRICLAGVGFNSAVLCYDVSANNLNLAWSTRPPSTENVVTGDYTDSFSLCEFSEERGEVLAVEERQNANDVIHRLDTDGAILQSEQLIIPDNKVKHSTALYLGSVVSGHVAIGLDRGWIIVARVSDLSTNAFETNQTARTFLTEGNEIIFSTTKESLVWWTMAGRKVRQAGGAPVDQAIKMGWGVERDTFWLAGPSLLSLVQLDRGSGSCKLIGQVEGYHITCVGLSHSPESGALVAGDITGKVAVWAEDTTATHQCQLSKSVRCIMWTQNSGILIGCLDGSIYKWDNVSWRPPDKFCHLQGSVLHMRLSQSADRLAVGNSVGQLGVFRLGTSKVPYPLLLFYAHAREGGEVWSVCWSPDDTRLATASEDRSVRVWERDSTGAPLHTFLCHSAAVTAVDWKVTTRGSLLASCSDDRTVVLHCGNSYTTLCTINTYNIYGWYTLTYMRFSPLADSHLLACVTQNGHIVFYDVMAERQLCAIRLHLGSVEGFCWFRLGGVGRLATLSSDCTVQYYSTDKQ